MASRLPNVAFAGLGAMGFGMASHLVKSGFPVTGYDVYQPALDSFIKEGHGASSARTPREAVADTDFLICMVATSVQATPLLFDPDTGAVRGMKENATIIMCSTVAPAYIDEVQKRLKDQRPDIRLIDSPVSGGAGRAADGTLSIFASGEKAQLESAHSILQCMSGKLYDIPGGLGAGSKAKLIHQIFAGIHIAMASEAMGLAALAGFDTRHAYESLRANDGSSWMFENRVPPMLVSSHPPYSAITIIAKDVGIITTTSGDFRFPLPLVSIAEQLYLTSISAGWGKEDDCVTVRLYLPGNGDLVADQAGASGTVSINITLDTVQDLMIGVHTAAVSEAMSFCERLGIDTDLMFDIVSNAAGASRMFVKAFEPMKQGGWSLKAAPDAKGIRDRLVSAISPRSILED
ncbi:MAG: hypothetical protein Q9201_006726 [Fulgogasparrea decipioides]